MPDAVPEPRLTSLAHGGGCGCKIAPGVLEDILRGATALPMPPELLVGIETSDDAAVWQLNDRQAVVATTDFFAAQNSPDNPGRHYAGYITTDAIGGGGTTGGGALPPGSGASNPYATAE